MSVREGLSTPPETKVIILRPPRPEDGWKKKLFTVLCDCGIISSEYTGQVVLNLNSGSISDLEKREKLL